MFNNNYSSRFTTTAATQSAPNCPRCASSNTKFCYYNNYSLSQPRYFCKGCRRYWTKGGSLRNVPVGGGCRKSRRRGRSSTAIANFPSPRRYAEESGSSGDIDLAAVFAKYVSQNNNTNNNNSVGENEMSFSPEGSSGSSSQMEYEKALDEREQVIPDISAVDCQGLVYQDFNGCDLQQDDELGILWSSELINFDFEWQQQQQQQPQDLGDYLFDDEFTACENLGLFDLSGYEYFSRP